MIDWMVTSAPRNRVGASSPMYIGVTAAAIPTPNPSTMRPMIIWTSPYELATMTASQRSQDVSLSRRSTRARNERTTKDEEHVAECQDPFPAERVDHVATEQAADERAATRARGHPFLLDVCQQALRTRGCD